jgi:copper oxidase (laccase) domain-containing protein
MTNNLMPQILNSAGFQIVFSTKHDGNMLRTNETRTVVHENRMKFLKHCGIRADDLALIRTSHSPNIDILERSKTGFSRRTYIRPPVIDTDFDFYYAGSDGLLTFQDDLYIGLLSGDCVPVIVWDSSSGLHGILHVGLLGALNGMVMGLQRVLQDIGVKSSDVYIYLGPSITQRNYNISRSGLWSAIVHQVDHKEPDVRRFIEKREDGEFFDVQGLISSQLQEAGIDFGHIQTYDHCIAEDDSLFISHSILKQSGIRGNFFSIIGRAKRGRLEA